MTRAEINLRSQISPEPNTGCWIWMGRTNAKGYGSAGTELAHRRSYRMERGPIPAGLYVLHKCNVRCCVNPDHLYVGDQIQNMRDRAAAGHNPRGERAGNARLTNAQAAELKRLYRAGVNYRELAVLFGLKVKTAYWIAHGPGYEAAIKDEGKRNGRAA